jgi:hypothetical protein
MTQNGSKRGANLGPAPKGNQRALRHGAFARFTPAQCDEVGRLEDEVRELVPLESPSVEPVVSALAGRCSGRACSMTTCLSTAWPAGARTGQR